MNKISKRILSPYEKNQLLKYSLDQKVLLKTDAPVEYITGHVDFCGFDFFVDKNVLIPRVETEELVEMVVGEAGKKWKSQSSSPKIRRPLKIIDVGTGSGAIAISVAKKLGAKGVEFEMTALDISEKALEIARRNYEKLSGKNNHLKIKFKRSDLLESIEDEYDFIIANLPYIPSSRIKKIDNSVKDFEPRLALDGGDDGLDLVRKLLIHAKTVLTKNGVVFLELDITHTQEKMKEFEDDWKIEIRKSEFGGVRFGITKLKKLSIY